MKRERGFCVLAIIVVAVITINKPIIASSIDASFEVRLAPGEADALIMPGEVLNLETWLTLSGTETTYDVQIISFFLDVNDLENNIITFNEDYVNDTILPITEISLPNDNTPISGEFSRGLLSFGTTATFNDNVPQKFGHFSVTGVADGTVNYSFNDDGSFREWLVYIVGPGETNNLLPTIGTTAISITVTPEPTTLFLLALGSLAMLKRKWKSA